MKVKRALSLVVATLFLVMSSNITSLALEINAVMEMNSSNYTEKISQDVSKHLQKSKEVEILVEMKEKADLDETVIKLESLNSKYSLYDQKIMRKHSINNALMETANITQNKLIEYLENNLVTGNVQAYESYYIVNMIYVKCNEEVVNELAKMKEVKAIHLDKIIQLERPTIEKEISTYSTSNIEWGVERIGAVNVWEEYGITGEGVVVGVIDSGVAWEHEALKTKWRGYNPENPSTPTPEGNWFDAVAGKSLPYDDIVAPHGTHVTGTILGQEPNGNNAIGVAPGAKFIAAKAFTEEGGQSSWILAAGQWMLAPGGKPSLAPDIINNSWGGGSGLDEWYRDMVKVWRVAGILPVFAAGNEEGRPAPVGSVSSPANYPESFAVGANDINNVRGSFSRRGPGPYENDVKPDISAPGVSIRSSVPGGYEGGWNGTSMAAPHVSGAAALILSYNPLLTSDDLESILTETATPLTDSDYSTSPNYGYGHGNINVFEAIASISTGLGEISGSVLQNGQDLESPEIVDYTMVDYTYAGMNIPIEVTAKDDVSIRDVSVLVKGIDGQYDVVIPMNNINGDYKVGKYVAEIPGRLAKGESISYKIRVTDYKYNVVESEYCNATIYFGIKPSALEYDFIEEPTDWFLISGDWQWGIPEGAMNKGENDKVMGTNLTGKYSLNSDSYLVTPLLDLRDETYAYMTLDQWYETEPRYDRCIIAATNNYGENWSILKEYSGYKREWHKERVSLSEFAGSDTPVLVAFYFVSDDMDNRLGWYIDNVKLYGEDTTPPETVENLVGNAGVSGVELAWDTIANNEMDFKEYKIYRSTTSQSIDMAESIASTRGTQYLDTEAQSGVGYRYFVTAIDEALNEGERSNTIEVKMPEFSRYYSENFDNGDGNFTTEGTNNCWQWGVSNDDAVGSSKLWGTNLTGTYSSSCNAWIQSPDIDIPEANNAKFIYSQLYETEKNYDKCYVEIKRTTEEAWKELAVYHGGNSKLWEDICLDISEYVGDTINIRFRISSDSSVNKKGWYLDNISIVSMNDTILKDSIIEINEESTKHNKVEEIELRKFTNNHKEIEIFSEKDYFEEMTLSNGIPLKATVSIVETGKGTVSSLMDGSYTLRHPANKEGMEWTMEIASYGYDTIREKIKLNDGDKLRKNFKLEKSPEGIIQGKLVDEKTGMAIEGAFIQLVEDPIITPSITNAKGEFKLEKVLNGEYTLKVTHGSYYKKEIKVIMTSNEVVYEEVQMKPFIGYPGEIAYDDGTEESGLAMRDANNGWAIKAKPDKYGLVESVNVKLYSEEWPAPGGNEFKIAIYDTNEQGEKGQLIFMTDTLTGVRGQWNSVDVSEYGFMTDREFYVVMIQVKDGNNSPGICVDKNLYKGRSYQFVSGELRPLSAADGNIMIRVGMTYDLQGANITSIENNAYVSQESLEIKGIAPTDCMVHVYVNGELQQSVSTIEKEFATTIMLQDGPNTVEIASELEGKETDPVAITINRDSVNPIINIVTPSDEYHSNTQVITIEGFVEEENLSEIYINGVKENFQGEDNQFQKDIKLESGENIITIKAVDKANNQIERIVKVYFKKDIPQISNVIPNKDMQARPGEKIKISFDSNILNGKAYFAIQVPMNTEQSNTTINMVEVTQGHYEGTWTVPEKNIYDNLSIVVGIEDSYGNKFSKVADGVISVIKDDGYVAEIINVNVEEQFGVSTISAEIRNKSLQNINPTLIVMVTDKVTGRVINISTATISVLKPSDNITLGCGLNRKLQGEYNINVFVWDGLNTMVPLAKAHNQTVTIQ